MSAIVGHVDLSARPLDETAFGTAMAALSHYGTDGSATASGDGYRVGVQRHALTDRDIAELAPFRQGDRVIVADAVLTNRDAVITALGLDRRAGGTLPDAALMLRCYDRWGDNCAAHLRGDYAFAVYDNAARRLFLTRDHIGTRPLYWARIGSRIVFTTDIRAILAETGHNWAVEESAVVSYLLNPLIAHSEVFFRGIASVPPATSLRIDAGGTRPTTWWSPRDVPELRYRSDAEYVEHFRALTAEVVADHVAPPGETGSHFSGGIDSSTVAALAMRALQARGRRLKAGYGWAPPVSDAHPMMGKRDERRKIEALGDMLGLPVRYGSADARNLCRFIDRPLELDGISDLHDEVPVLDLAQRDGLKVMLSGWGGDEAFSAYGTGYLAYALKTGRLREARKALGALTGARRFRPRQAMRTLWKFGVVPTLPDVLHRRVAPYDTTFSEDSFAAARLAALAPECEADGAVRLVSDPRRYLQDLVLQGHLPMRMETWAAWSSRHGFQYRYPLLDRRILEFVLGMPRHLFLADGKPRYLARMASEGVVPENLNKYDQANEFLRQNTRLDGWRILRDQMSQGAFAGDSDWVDMDALRASIAQVPDRMDEGNLQRLAQIIAALRVWKMEQRLRQGSGPGT